MGEKKQTIVMPIFLELDLRGHTSPTIASNVENV